MERGPDLGISPDVIAPPVWGGPPSLPIRRLRRRARSQRGAVLRALVGDATRVSRSAGAGVLHRASMVAALVMRLMPSTVVDATSHSARMTGHRSRAAT
jgi:hypothetical protein